MEGGKSREMLVIAVVWARRCNKGKGRQILKRETRWRKDTAPRMLLEGKETEKIVGTKKPLLLEGKETHHLLQGKETHHLLHSLGRRLRLLNADRHTEDRHSDDIQTDRGREGGGGRGGDLVGRRVGLLNVCCSHETLSCMSVDCCCLL